MYKSEAEDVIRRTCEESGKEMSDQEVTFMAEVIIKICTRIVEEAVANISTNKPGSRPTF